MTHTSTAPLREARTAARLAANAAGLAASSPPAWNHHPMLGSQAGLPLHEQHIAALGELQDGYTLKLIAAYDRLERELDVAAPLHVGHIAVATCLSWLEFRGLPACRDGRPRLTTWLEQFERRPSMRATPLAGETQD